MEKKEIKRNLVLCFLIGAMFFILLGRLFQLQIISGEEYAEKFRLKIKREIPLAGMRGNIYDCNGNPLARSRLAYSVTFEDGVEYDSDRTRQLSLNGKIYKIITIMKKHGDHIESSLQIRLNKYGDYEFTEDGFSLERFKADVYGKSRIEDMEEKERNAAPDDIVAYLADRFCIDSQNEKAYTIKEKEEYGLPGELGKENLLEMLNVRYALSLQAYQKYLPALIARDVSDETAVAILENQPELYGADIREESVRIYEGGEACTPIIGYTGKISLEELKEKEEKGSTISWSARSRISCWKM